MMNEFRRSETERKNKVIFEAEIETENTPEMLKILEQYQGEDAEVTVERTVKPGEIPEPGIITEWKDRKVKWFEGGWQVLGESSAERGSLLVGKMVGDHVETKIFKPEDLKKLQPFRVGDRAPIGENLRIVGKLGQGEYVVGEVINNSKKCEKKLFLKTGTKKRVKKSDLIQGKIGELESGLKSYKYNFSESAQAVRDSLNRELEYWHAKLRMVHALGAGHEESEFQEIKIKEIKK